MSRMRKRINRVKSERPNKKRRGRGQGPVSGQGSLQEPEEAPLEYSVHCCGIISPTIRRNLETAEHSGGVTGYNRYVVVGI